MKKVLSLILTAFILGITASAQSPAEILAKIKAKVEKVNDYEADGKMKTNVAFIKAPVATVKVYFKKPNKLRIRNEKGISFVPKGSINVNLGSLFVNNADYDIIDVGTQDGLRVLKLLPKDEKSDVVLSTLYIDEKKLLITKAKTTTRENGTYELEMVYGKYADYALADKVVFTFNTKEYKLPKGITFDYDDGSKKQTEQVKQAEQKGRVEISYSNYVINKGISDKLFN